MPAVLVKWSMKLFRMISCKLLQREEKIRVHLHLVIILTRQKTKVMVLLTSLYRSVVLRAQEQSEIKAEVAVLSSPSLIILMSL